jgi:hypothetical protein
MKRKKNNTNPRSMITIGNINVYDDCSIERKTSKEHKKPQRAIPKVHTRRRLHICQLPGRSKLLRSDTGTSNALPIVLEAWSSLVTNMTTACAQNKESETRNPKFQGAGKFRRANLLIFWA